MRILQLLQHLDIIQLDVQELVDGSEGALDGDVVFKFDGDLVVDEGFEETVGLWVLAGGSFGGRIWLERGRGVVVLGGRRVVLRGRRGEGGAGGEADLKKSMASERSFSGRHGEGMRNGLMT